MDNTASGILPLEGGQVNDPISKPLVKLNLLKLKVDILIDEKARIIKELNLAKKAYKTQLRKEGKL